MIPLELDPHGFEPEELPDAGMDRLVHRLLGREQLDSGVPPRPTLVPWLVAPVVADDVDFVLGLTDLDGERRRRTLVLAGGLGLLGIAATIRTSEETPDPVSDEDVVG